MKSRYAVKSPGTLEAKIEKCWYSVLVCTSPLKALVLNLSWHILQESRTTFMLSCFSNTLTKGSSSPLLVASPLTVCVSLCARYVLKYWLHYVIYLVTLKIIIENWVQFELRSKIFICVFNNQSGGLIMNGPMTTRTYKWKSKLNAEAGCQWLIINHFITAKNLPIKTVSMDI